MSPIIQIVVALAGLYFVLGTVASGINEAIATVLSRRAKYLRRAITELLDGYHVDLAGAFFASRHYKDLQTPRATRRGKPTDPSYVPPNVFAEAVVGELDRRLAASDDEQDEWRGIEKLPKTHPLHRVYAAVAGASPTEISSAADELERWFNAAMDRVTGWYRRSARLTLVGVAIALVGILNIDSVQIVNRLWQDDVVRGTAEAAAVEWLDQAADGLPTTGVTEVADGSGGDADAAIGGDATTTAGDLEAEIDELLAQLDAVEGLGVELGWREVPDNARAWASKLVGLLATAAMVLLGAPFWFDLFKNVSGVRNTGPRPARSGVADGD